MNVGCMHVLRDIGDKMRDGYVYLESPGFYISFLICVAKTDKLDR
jgi:hypothetical protein